MPEVSRSRPARYSNERGRNHGCFKTWATASPLRSAGAVGLLIFGGTASAQTTRGDFYFQQTATGTDVGCDGLTGTFTNTATTVGQFVDTGQGFHVHGATTQEYRTDWLDGSYSINHSPSHFEFNTNSRGQFVATEAQQDRGTRYSPDGQVIGGITVFTLTHITWKDTNGNNEADSGEITATVDHRVTCS